MDYRLTFEERNLIADQLRQHLLSKEDPRRLSSIEDSSCQPHRYAAGTYAFEFFLDRFREKFKKIAGDKTAYNIGWSGMAIRMNEENWSLERMIRMSAELFMIIAEERGYIEQFAEWFSNESYGQSCIEQYRVKLFAYELIYELARELSRSKAESLGYK